jgi:hypothetical protein
MSIGILLGKATVRCPNCNKEFEAYTPDRAHPFWSLEKPRPSQYVGNIIKEIKKCSDPFCGGKVTLYWYNRMVTL